MSLYVYTLNPKTHLDIHVDICATISSQAASFAMLTDRLCGRSLGASSRRLGSTELKGLRLLGSRV